MKLTTALYESEAPINPARKFCAFLVRDVTEVKDGKRTGNIVKEHLPLAFYAATGEEATRKAIQFWDDETAKERARKERGRALAKQKTAKA